MIATNKSDVLIIDDDKIICEVFKEYCTSLKCFNKVAVSSDAMGASFKLRNQKFGLIILDISMPGKNGFDILVREFTEKGLNKKENILVISGTLEPAIVSKLIQNGVKNFLVKPVDEEIFKEKITKMTA